MKIATIVGARPQFIKAAPISRELRLHAITEVLIHSGQHYDANMSQVFFDDLQLPAPDYNLAVGSGPQGAQTGKMLERIEAVLIQEKPHWVLVYGDTNSTLAGALAAAKVHIPVAHVEAGLRSYDRSMPEEINRIVADQLSNLLFCPTENAVGNLAREGITAGVKLVGDVMHDVLLVSIKTAEKRSTILRRLGVAPKTYCLATLHRAANTDDAERLASILRAFQQINEFSRVIWPLHPRTRQRLESYQLGSKANGLHIIDPVPYLDMLALEQNARLIMTDSGGAQKEAFWLGVPCITLRETTEWLETLQDGWNILAGTDAEDIVALVNDRLTRRFSRRNEHRNESAASKIVQLLMEQESSNFANRASSYAAEIAGCNVFG